MERSRTIHWEDPMEGAKKARDMSGLDYLSAIKNGEIPPAPVVQTLDFKLGNLARGEVEFTFEPQEFHYNPIGTVHGGVISTILDSAMGCSLHSVLEAGTGYTTLELKVNFLKAITIKTGTLKATGKILHAGGRTALVEARLADQAGTLYAYGVSTCLIIRG